MRQTAQQSDSPATPFAQARTARKYSHTAPAAVPAFHTFLFVDGCPAADGMPPPSSSPKKLKPIRKKLRLKAQHDDPLRHLRVPKPRQREKPNKPLPRVLKPRLQQQLQHRHVRQQRKQAVGRPFPQVTPKPPPYRRVLNKPHEKPLLKPVQRDLEQPPKLQQQVPLDAVAIPPQLNRRQLNGLLLPPLLKQRNPPTQRRLLRQVGTDYDAVLQPKPPTKQKVRQLPKQPCVRLLVDDHPPIKPLRQTKPPPYPPKRNLYPRPHRVPSQRNRNPRCYGVVPFFYPAVTPRRDAESAAETPKGGPAGVA